MFEKMKAYKNLRKANKFFINAKKLAELTNNKEMESEANECLYLNQLVRNRIIFSGKVAKEYNLEHIRKGIA